MRAAASRTFCTAGNRRPMRTAMMAMTTSNSISVNPGRRRERKRNMRSPPTTGTKGKNEHAADERACSVQGRHVPPEELQLGKIALRNGQGAAAAVGDRTLPASPLRLVGEDLPHPLVLGGAASRRVRPPDDDVGLLVHGGDEQLVGVAELLQERLQLPGVLRATAQP